MSRPIILGTCALALVLAAAAWRLRESSQPAEIPFEPASTPAQTAPRCPWRDPAGDLREFFPGATRFEPGTHILSGLRLQLAQRLGRAPTGDENLLSIYRIVRDEAPLGTILTGRVKGTYGAIEIVVAVGLDRRARGVKIQRLREPEPIAATLLDAAWLGRFAGRAADSPRDPERDLAGLPDPARESATAVADGVRSLLVLFDTAEESGPPGTPAHVYH